MHFLSLIEAKRDGLALSPAQIREFVTDCVAGQLADYQLASFLMAIYFRGLDEAETRSLTLAMRDSGDVLHFPKDARPLADKHSTGGVGDKVSLPLAPLLACLGMRVPMISGRGLGITGGTLDKLESIPGFQTSLPAERLVELVQNVGCVICGQTERMVPADKRLYALRDVTGTVPSISLIVASILSKKLAESLDALVLDVKFGAAAFMPTLDKAGELARAMVALGCACGVNTRALLTNMDVPLGRAAGNWLEVKEAVACLEGNTGRQSADDLRAIVLACAAHLLLQTGLEQNLDAALKRAEACLASGEPRRKWDEMLAAQGADLEAFQRKLEAQASTPVTRELIAEHSGYVSRCDARLIGEIVRDLGGGRLAKDSLVDHAVGIDSLAKPGEKLKRGSVLARVHASLENDAISAVARLGKAFVVSDEPPPPGELIARVVVGEGSARRKR